MTYHTDGPFLFMRESVDLDPELAAELAARIPNVGQAMPGLTIIADTIMLSGAEIADRDVTLIARVIMAGVQGVPPLRLYRSGHAPDGEVTTAGQVFPPIPVEGLPPEKGKTGNALTVYTHGLIGPAFAESHGQRGGRGLQGPRERRHSCEINPDMCEGMPPWEIADVESTPGGAGLRGGDGGEGGSVQVFCVTDLAHNESLWRGVGGPGGYGGKGGRGGPGVIPDPENPGNLGPTGPAGARPGLRPGDVQVITEAEWLERVKAHVAGPAETAGELWAEFKRREAATVNRYRFLPFAGTDSLDRAADLAPETPASTRLRGLLRDHSAQHGMELDVDLVGTPDIYEAQMAPARAAMDAVVAPLRPAPGIFDLPAWLDAGRLAPSAAALRTSLGALIDSGEFTVQRNEATDRQDLARNARRAAHVNRHRTAERLDARLNAAAATLIVAVPAAGVTLNRDALRGLRTALLTLAPALPIDDTENPDPPTGPSSDPAVLLPSALGLLVHTSIRDTGPHKQYPPDVPNPPAVYSLPHVASWPTALQASTGDAIDLTEIAAQLRSALRPGATADPAAVAIAHDLAELAETQHAWRMADLRLAQATTAVNLLPEAEAQARAALAALPNPPSGASDQYFRYLRGLRALGDLLSWRTHRAHRAHDQYTLDLTPFDLRRALNFEAFDPVINADLGTVPEAALTQAQSRAAKAARKLTVDMDFGATTSIMASVTQFRARGTEVTKFLAPRVFCATSGVPGSDCEVPSPHVFDALQHPLSRGFWLDVDLADVQGEHREAKIHGALIRFFYDLSGGESPPEEHAVDLVHQGLARQRQLQADTVHEQRGLPRGSRIAMKRVGDSAVWEGLVDAAVVGTGPFPAYGRGVAGGYRLELVDQGQSRPDLLTQVEVHIQYEARQDEAIVNLNTTSLSGAVVPGSTASGLITLTGPAPADGLKVRLRSSDPSAVSVPGEVIVPEGQTTRAFTAHVLKATGPFPPRLTASTLDGVNRHSLLSVRAPALPQRTAVLGPASEEATAYAVAVGRMTSGSGGPRPAATVFASRTPLMFTGEPVERSDYALHTLRADLTPLTERQIDFWPRALAVDEGRGRLYVLHGDTLSLLDPETLATTATRLIGVNATSVAVDPAAELVYVTRYSHGTIHVLRGADLSVVQVFGDVPTLRGCGGIAVHPAGKRLYVARNYRIADPTATAVTSIVRRPDGSHVIDRDTHLPEPGLQPHAVAVDGRSGLVFVACQGGGGMHPTLLTMDAASLNVISTVAIPGPGMSVAARQGTGIAHVAAYTGLVLVDGRAGAVTLTVKAGTHPLGVAVDEQTGVAYLTDRVDHTVTRIETPATAAVLRAWH